MGMALLLPACDPGSLLVPILLLAMVASVVGVVVIVVVLVVAAQTILFALSFILLLTLVLVTILSLLVSVELVTSVLLLVLMALLLTACDPISGNLVITHFSISPLLFSTLFSALTFRVFFSDASVFFAFTEIL